MSVRKVKVVRIGGYVPGEEVFLPTNRALTYVRNGQAKPIGWEDTEGKESQPVNRMLNTSRRSE